MKVAFGYEPRFKGQFFGYGQLAKTFKFGVDSWDLKEGEHFEKDEYVLTVSGGPKVGAGVQAPRSGSIAEIRVPGGTVWEEFNPDEDRVVFCIVELDRDLREKDMAEPPAPILLLDTGAADSPSRVERKPAAEPVEAAERSTPSPRQGGVLNATPLARKLAETAGIDLAEIAPADPRRIEKSDVSAVLAARAAPREVQAMPRTRKLAAEAGIDLAAVTGTGPGGLVRESDLPAAGRGAGTVPVGSTVESARSSSFALSVEQDGLIRLPADDMKKKTAANLDKVWRIPHAWAHVDVDVTELEALIKQLKVDAGERVGFNLFRRDYFLAAAVRLAVTDPSARFLPLNGFWDDARQEIAAYSFVNVGFAASRIRTVPGGREEYELAVLSVRDAHKKSFFAMAREADGFLRRYKEGKSLSLGVMGTETITVNNVGARNERGVPGVEYPGPLLASPQTSTLVAQGATRGTPDGRKTARLTIAFDHRVVNGALAGEFLRTVQFWLEHPHLLLTVEPRSPFEEDEYS
ncbi:2-oxo acid dehydrogenase subunit E2 [bacterium]|nr:2-oxo acid dehydrogenase subunit E2 [candidate division CSSED10-310 bacterium]